VRRRAEEFALKYIESNAGSSSDWRARRLGNPYLTLAPAYEAEVLRAFAIFVDKGWSISEKASPVEHGAQTALAEAEVEYQQRVDPRST
jgi:isoleucyl-tRNA synthetase